MPCTGSNFRQLFSKYGLGFKFNKYEKNVPHYSYVSRGLKPIKVFKTRFFSPLHISLSLFKRCLALSRTFTNYLGFTRLGFKSNTFEKNGPHFSYVSRGLKLMKVFKTRFFSLLHISLSLFKTCLALG